MRAGELRKHGIRLKVQDQPFRVLRILLEHPGEVVTREELQRQIWPSDTFVDFDRGLNNAVKRLREALADSADEPRYIETIPKRGYRFIAPVNKGNGDEAEVTTASVEAPASAVPERPVSRRSLRISMLVTTGVILVALLSALALRSGSLRERLLGKPAVPPLRSIAVLPLLDLSNDSNQEYFADGMTDALITDLAQIASLKVISRTSVMRYKKTDKSLPEIARELNVDGIIEGTVQHSGDRVRITAQLIHGPTDKHLWAKSYERDMRDVLTLEADVARSFAEEIQARLTPQEKARLAQPRPANLKALGAYLQGERHLTNYSRGYNVEELKRAADYFMQAATEDPNFALAFVKLSETYDWELEMSLPSDVMPREKAAAEKALSLDPNLSDAHLALARVKFSYEWDWTAAEKELRKALELNPSNADAHELLGDYLQAMGRLTEGLDEQQRAQELDPHRDHISNGFYRTRQYDRGIEWLRKQIEINPREGVHHIQLTGFYGQQRMQREYIEETVRFLTLYGFPQPGESLRRNYAKAGYTKALREFCAEVEKLQEHGTVSVPGMLADLYVRVGDKEKAFYWLEEAYRERDGGMPYLNCVPGWDPLRSDPRFGDLVRRVGLPTGPVGSATN